MGLNHYKLLHIYLITVDLIAMIFSFLVAASAVVSEVDGVPFTQFLSIRISILNFLIFIAFTLFWYLILALAGGYYVRRLNQKKDKIKNIIQITSFGTLSLLVFSVIFNIRLVTPLFLLVFWFMTTTIALLSRITVRFIIRKSWLRGINLQNAVIVGTNATGGKIRPRS